jgi:hypothetical protein
MPAPENSETAMVLKLRATSQTVYRSHSRFTSLAHRANSMLSRS